MKIDQLLIIITLACQPLWADLVIDGSGNKLQLTDAAALSVPSATKVTLKNLTLTGLKGNRLVMSNGTSKLVLDNAKLVLEDLYSFSQGSIEVLNNSSIEGESSFTFSGHNLFIAKSSTLKIGNNTTFVCTPTRGINTAIRFEDNTSTLFLDGATFRNNGIGFTGEATGLVFTNGNFEIDGTSVLDSIGTSTDAALMLGTGPSGDGDTKLLIRPHAKLVVKNAGIVYRNHVSGSFNTSGGLGTIELRDSGKFVVQESQTPVSSTGINARSPWDIFGQNVFTLDGNSLNLDFSDLKGQRTGGSITSFVSGNKLGSGLDFSGRDAEAVFSPDGKYAVVGLDSGSGTELRAYSFDPTSATPLTELGAGVDVASTIDSLVFTPDGKYVIVSWTSNFQAVYTFDPTSATPLVLLGSTLVSGDNFDTIDVTPDGRFAGGATTGPAQLYLFRLDPTLATPLVQVGTAPTVSNNIARGSRFSPDGKYMAVVFDTSTGTELRAYSVDPTAATPFTEIGTGLEFGTFVFKVDWSPDGKFIAIGGTTANDIRVYRFDPQSSNPFGALAGMATAAVLDNVEALRWSPDGNYLAAGYRSNTGTDDREIFQFNATAGTLTSLGTVASAAVDNWTVSTEWSPNGKYLLLAHFGNAVAVAGDSVEVYEPTRGNPSAELKVSGGTMKLAQDTKLSNVKVKTS